MPIKALILLLFLITTSVVGHAQQFQKLDAIYSGIPWYDSDGNIVSAHGACIVKDQGGYYLFGEKHSDTSNAFAGFTCYSSPDLYNWKFESMALPVQDTGKMGPRRVGERVKVMKCPKTGEYIMYMHADTLGYTDQYVGYATSDNITGPYHFKGPLLYNGKPIRKWDMGTFQDNDGAGYVLLHGGDIYQLSDDYKTATAQVCKSFDREFEAPALFRKDSIYYFIGSHLSSWEKNDNYYFTATSLQGPWTPRGLLAPAGTLTWYSQTTFVLPITGSTDTTCLFMGDRWSFPKQASAATYVWQPITVAGLALSIPNYQQAWKVNTTTGVAAAAAVRGTTITSGNKKQITYSGQWRQDTLSVNSSDEKGASFQVKFSGTQIGFYGLARPSGGYAQVTLQNSKGKIIVSAIVDMYSKYAVSAFKFLSPVFKKGNYTLTVSVMGERGNWSDKRKNLYGSTGNVISLDRVIVNK